MARRCYAHHMDIPDNEKCPVCEVDEVSEVLEFPSQPSLQEQLEETVHNAEVLTEGMKLIVISMRETTARMRRITAQLEQRDREYQPV